MEVPSAAAHDRSMSVASPLQLLFLALLAALTVAGCGVSLEIGGDADRRVERRSFDVDGGATVIVTTENGAVDVRAATGDRVEVEAVLVASDAGDARFHVVEAAERLEIHGECVDDSWWDECQVGFDVVVPDDVNLVVRTDNGHIGVDGAGADVELESGNGAIAAENLAASQARARTSNGRIALAFATAPADVEVRSGNGAVVVRVPEGDAYDVETSTHNGAVDVDVDRDPAARRQIRATTDNGAIEIAGAG